MWRTLLETPLLKLVIFSEQPMKPADVHIAPVEAPPRGRLSRRSEGPRVNGHVRVTSAGRKRGASSKH